MKRIPLIGLVLVSTACALAQSRSRLHPGKIYEPGEHIYAPKYGFSGIIPEDWDGTIPRGNEIFSMMPRTSFGGEIFTFVSVGRDIQSIKESWVKGVKLTETVLIKADGNIGIDGNLIMGEVTADGDNVNKGNYKGYAVAKCSPYGPCITCLGIAPMQFYDQVSATVERFMRNASFAEPSDVSPYADFDWREFLSGKMLIAFTAIENKSHNRSKENTIDLCGNGTFTAHILKKGFLNNYNPKYKGKQSGVWTMDDIGDHGVLKLNFKKLPATEIALRIEDEKIFADGERYFAAESDKCR
jgi:hypothetical protein